MELHMNYSMSRTITRSRAVVEMQKEARRLRNEFQAYLEDLELFSKPDFWEAVEQSKNAVPHKSFKSYRKKLGV